LRVLTFGAGLVALEEPIEVATAPAYPIRGHQLGYRDRANSWDAWTVEQFEKYIRELVLFGTNCIENIPFQDDRPSPHMKVPRSEMNRALSEICAAYDIDYWVWTPAVFDLADVEKRAAALGEHEQLYRDCPRLDGVFFPGGDPGDNHPRLVMPFLEELAGRLRVNHPRAGIWLSLQGFDAEEVDWFHDYLREGEPAWLAGVVSGPGSPPLGETRRRLPARYRHRHYPDITHTVRCQYPVEWWDQAFALTLGREPPNPRPAFYARVHNTHAPVTDGFLTYSDGIHDDVNKVVWSMLGWDPDRDPRQIAVEYCRFFFGGELAERAADGILALERNWAGALEENGGVEATLALWQGLARERPALAENWRWQLCLLRAHYDAYTRRRLIHERGLEREAMAILGEAGRIGADRAMQLALARARQAETQPIARELRAEIERLCDGLFGSIGLQTSVSKYRASGSERGCVLDFVDYPLNNRWWLEDQFAQIAALAGEEPRLARLRSIRTWAAPGLGSYYDNIGGLADAPHLDRTTEAAPDYAWWDDGLSRARLSSQLYQNWPRLAYVNLDPACAYRLRVAGYGEALLRADGCRLAAVLYDKAADGFKEFPVPPALTADGELVITFDRPDEAHLNWRQYSRVSDVWLLRD